MTSARASIVFQSFDGGRFYKNRRVHAISVRFPHGIPNIWRDGLSRECWHAAWKTCQSHNPERASTGSISRHRNALVMTAEFANADAVVQALCGRTVHQAIYRVMRSRTLWAVRRPRSMWWCESKWLPLEFMPMSYKSRSRAGRIPKQYEDTFAAMADSAFDPEYSAFDLGPDRKLPLWTCNRCGHSDVWQGWPKRDIPGVAASEFIASCPECGAAKAKHEMQMLAEDFLGKSAFRPFRTMQDDWVFSV